MSQNAVEFQQLLETAYPITYNCYCARTEIKYEWGGYLEELTDPDNIVYNSVHKTASLYDAFYYLRKQWETDRSTLTTEDELKNYWYKLGGYCGLITRIIMTPPPTSDQSADTTETWPPTQPTLDSSQDQASVLENVADQPDA